MVFTAFLGWANSLTGGNQRALAPRRGRQRQGKHASLTPQHRLCSWTAPPRVPAETSDSPDSSPLSPQTRKEKAHLQKENGKTPSCSFPTGARHHRPTSNPSPSSVIKAATRATATTLLTIYSLPDIVLNAPLTPSNSVTLFPSCLHDCSSIHLPSVL